MPEKRTKGDAEFRDEAVRILDWQSRSLWRPVTLGLMRARWVVGWPRLAKLVRAMASCSRIALPSWNSCGPRWPSCV